jgi:uncharacterized protein (DUF1697 family)
MASRQIALLRGINVGRAKRVAMADLRALVEGLGYSDVRTLLNSGNVIFTVPRGTKGNAAKRIEDAIEEQVGFTSRVIVLTASEIDTVIEENPLVDIADNNSRLFAAILNNTSDRKKLEPLLEQDWGDDALALGTLAAYFWCANGLLESKIPEAVGRLLRDAVTTRNWATMLKLQGMAGGEREGVKDER